MKRKSQSKPAHVNRRTFTAGLSAAGLLAGTAPFNIVRAQGSALKVGVLLPRSGYQAGIGQDCQRGVDITAGILKDLGLPSRQIMNADTETNVDVARARATSTLVSVSAFMICREGRPRSFKIPAVISTPRWQSWPMPAW